jgi:prolyl-tRNA synthetase
MTTDDETGINPAQVKQKDDNKSVSKSPDSIEEKMKVSLDKSDFNEWYANVVELSNLTDKRYPIKGMNVWTAYGWKVMRLIDGLMRDEMSRTGHDEVSFPLLISEEQFAKEAEHIKGFDDEVYWVTRAGGEELDVKLLLRPTSETAMYPIFALWVRSHSDLPLKTFQLVNTFRYDTKQTRAFIRVREIHFFEAHTCHSDFDDAERQIAEDLEIMESLGKKLCLSYLLLKRPDADRDHSSISR